MIRIENLRKTYRAADGREVEALADIELEIGAGEVFGIIGRSGAGKSTLIRTLNLLERPSAGRVLIDGEDITTLDSEGLYALRRRVGMIFQHFNLLGAKTVADNIDWPLKATGHTNAAERAVRVKELLALVGLSEQGHKYPSQLSGGQKQRVASRARSPTGRRSCCATRRPRRSTPRPPSPSCACCSTSTASSASRSC